MAVAVFMSSSVCLVSYYLVAFFRRKEPALPSGAWPFLFVVRVWMLGVGGHVLFTSISILSENSMTTRFTDS